MLKNTKIYRFFDQVKQEARKVVWPEKKELVTSIMIVVIAVLIVSMISMFLDYGIHNLVRFILNLGK